MNILLGWSQHTPDLSRWELLPFAHGSQFGPQNADRRDRYERIVAVEPPGQPLTGGPFDRVSAAIHTYDIFPELLVQRVLRRRVEVGDTVGLCYRLLPGFRLFMGCRVTDVFEEHSPQLVRSGFTYRTLKGHAAIGEETFAVEKELVSGHITVSLSSWSRPGHWLMRLGYWYARWCQIHAARKALEHLQQIADAEHRERPASLRS